MMAVSTALPNAWDSPERSCISKTSGLQRRKLKPKLRSTAPDGSLLGGLEAKDALCFYCARYTILAMCPHVVYANLLGSNLDETQRPRWREGMV